jgi:hypothetical protein
LSQQENVVLKTEAQFQWILQDLQLDGGTVFTAGRGKKGMAFAVPENDIILIKELFYEDEEIKQRLLRAIQSTFGTHQIRLISRNDIGHAHRFGMIKPMDHTVLQHICPSIYMSIMLD